MKLLLDTHIWLWGLLEPHRLSRRVQQAIESADNERWLSPISTWEAMLLHAKRRIAFDEKAAAWISRGLTNTREAPLTHEIALAAAQLPWRPRDPADRFLVATAQVLGLTLVTADERLLALKDIATMSNR